MTVSFFAFNFKVRNCALELRIPVDQALAAVDEAFFVKFHESFNDNLRELRVHREVKAIPIHAVTHTAHLLQNRAAGELLPFPDFRNEVFTLHVSTGDAFLFKLAFYNDLSGNAGMICARQPHCVVARHAVIAGKRIHYGLIKGMAHVQDACNVGRGELNGKSRLFRIKAGFEAAALFPGRVPARFNFIGFKTLGEFLRFFIRHGELSTNKEGFARSLGVIPRARKEKSKAEAGQTTVFCVNSKHFAIFSRTTADLSQRASAFENDSALDDVGEVEFLDLCGYGLLNG